eukprot:4363436-Amphidinium_carterae.1
MAHRVSAADFLSVLASWCILGLVLRYGALEVALCNAGRSQIRRRKSTPRNRTPRNFPQNGIPKMIKKGF